VGNFKVTVTKKPRYINEDKCTGCGTCMKWHLYEILPGGVPRSVQPGAV
jgi:heterodisulfide reductase subunit A